MQRGSSLKYLMGFIAATCVGCVVTPPYVEPDSGPTARVRFVDLSLMGDPITLYRYEDPMCAVGEEKITRFFHREEHRRLGIPLWDYDDVLAHETLVPANAVFYGKFEGGPGVSVPTYSCQLPISFSPEAGVDYEVLLAYSARPKACEARVFRIVGYGAEARRVPVQQHPSPPGACPLVRFRR